MGGHEGRKAEGKGGRGVGEGFVGVWAAAVMSVEPDGSNGRAHHISPMMVYYVTR